MAGRHQDVNTATGDVPQIHRGKCDSEVSSADGVEEGVTQGRLSDHEVSHAVRHRRSPGRLTGVVGGDGRGTGERVVTVELRGGPEPQTDSKLWQEEEEGMDSAVRRTLGHDERRPPW